MLKDPIMWRGIAGSAIAGELQTWQQNMKIACNRLNSESRFASEEVPWLRQLAWLNYAFGAAHLLPKLPTPAYASLAVSNLISEEMQRLYKNGARLTNEFLSQHYNGVFNNYISLIDSIERSFFSHPQSIGVARSIQRKLCDIALSPAATWIHEHSIDPKDNAFVRQTAISHLRGIIAESELLPTEYNILKEDFLEQGFVAIYDAIYAVVMRSNLVSKWRRLPGAVYRRYDGEPITNLSGQLEEICVTERAHFALERVRDCDLSFKAVQLQSRNDSLTILNEIWQSDFETEASGMYRPNNPSSPWMPVKHVHLRQRKDPRVLRPHIEAREPEIHAALERGFRDYTMKFRKAS